MRGLGHALMAASLAWACTGAGAGELPRAADFAADAALAAHKKIPLLVLFSSPGCHYCERVKAEYLIPMHEDPAFAGRVLIREVSVGMTTPLTGFSGDKTTEGAFAAAAGVFMVPTVKIYDPRGRAVGEALVGLLSADFYYGYLLAAIDAGTDAARASQP